MLEHLSYCSFCPADGVFLMAIVVFSAPMKVLFTDYNILLTFICQEMLPNGKCSEDGSHIRLWSRDPTMDNDTREYVIGFAYWACIDPKLPGYLVNTTYDGMYHARSSCQLGISTQYRPNISSYAQHH